MTLRYLPRILDGILDEYLDIFGAVYVRGPKWCGKTTTAQRKARSILRMQEPDNAQTYRQMAALLPSRLLEGETPRLIDEWQMAPALWDAVRVEVDRRAVPGQFILTGSAVAQLENTSHSGTGRIATLDMYPMSLYESGESSGAVSLMGLFDALPFDGASSPLGLEGIALAICRGGWPASVGRSQRAALLIAENYVNSICEDDAGRMDGAGKDPRRVRALLRSYARNLSTLAANRTILRDLQENDVGMTESTLYRYVNALKRLFVVVDVPAWNPDIRSASSMRSTDKKGFSDPSIPAAALGLTPSRLLDDPNTFGFFFESLCIRDVRVYLQGAGAEISYYHDRYGLECDMVAHLRDGRYALLEAKLGSTMIDEGAAHLLELKSLIAENNVKNKKNIPLPAFLAVLTGGPYAYQRPDGVYVIPLACLKP